MRMCATGCTDTHARSTHSKRPRQRPPPHACLTQQAAPTLLLRLFSVADLQRSSVPFELPAHQCSATFLSTTQTHVFVRRRRVCPSPSPQPFRGVGDWRIASTFFNLCSNRLKFVVAACTAFQGHSFDALTASLLSHTRRMRVSFFPAPPPHPTHTTPPSQQVPALPQRVTRSLDAHPAPGRAAAGADAAEHEVRQIAWAGFRFRV